MAVDPLAQEARPSYEGSRDALLASIVEAFIQDAKEERYPPYGLVELNERESTITPITSFNPKDPFGHLGKGVLDSLLAHLPNPEGQFSSRETASIKKHTPIGVHQMPYFLALIPKLFARDLPDMKATPAVMADTARASYSSIPKKIAGHGKGPATVVVSRNLNKRTMMSFTSRFAGTSFSNLDANPFNDKEFRVDQSDGRTRIINATFEPYEGEYLSKICPASKTKVEVGGTALRGVWLRMIEIAEAHHFRDSSALEWALR